MTCVAVSCLRVPKLSRGEPRRGPGRRHYPRSALASDLAAGDSQRLAPGRSPGHSLRWWWWSPSPAATTTTRPLKDSCPLDLARSMASRGYRVKPALSLVLART